MYSKTQPLLSDKKQASFYQQQYQENRDLLLNLLDTPVKSVHHIGGTSHFNYKTEPILDVLVGVTNLHDITSLDEKRLNYAGFYRIHHHYQKKAMMVKFNNLSELKQEVRLHILQIESKQYQEYLDLNAALQTNIDLQTRFSQEKDALHASAETIRDYEESKARLFAKYVQLMKN